MSRKHLYLLGIFATIALGAFLYFKLCGVCLSALGHGELSEHAANQIKVQTPSPTYPFTVSDGEFSLSIDDNFNFYTDSPSFRMPISAKLKAGMDDLKMHLISQQDQALTVIGHYNAKEENSTPFPNLGLARANSVKNHLVLTGIPPTQIAVLGKLDDSMVQVGDIFLGPVSYALTKRDEDTPTTINLYNNE